jgi:hypothetical protein
MKFSRPVAVVAAVILLTGGMVAADAATSTSPIKLCSNNSSRVVQIPPKSGTCARGTTEFFVASQADVAALAQRVDTAESTLTTYGTRISDAETVNSAQASQLSAQASQIAALQATVEKLKPGRLVVTSTSLGAGAAYSFSVSGSELKPGTDVYRVFENSYWGSKNLGQVAADGSFMANGGDACSFGPFHIEATRQGDWGPIRTPVHTADGC